MKIENSQNLYTDIHTHKKIKSTKFWDWKNWYKHRSRGDVYYILRLHYS